MKAVNITDLPIANAVSNTAMVLSYDNSILQLVNLQNVTSTGSSDFNTLTNKPTTLYGYGIDNFPEVVLTSNVTLDLSDYRKHYTVTSPVTSSYYVTLPVNPPVGWEVRISASSMTFPIVLVTTDVVDRDKYVYGTEAASFIYIGGSWRRQTIKGFGFNISSTVPGIPDLNIPVEVTGYYRITADTANSSSRPAFMSTASAMLYTQKYSVGRYVQTIFDSQNNNTGKWTRTSVGGTWGPWASDGMLARISSANRPSNVAIGSTIYDTTLNKIVSFTNANTWVDYSDFTNISNKPTTLSGYGITDAASATHTHDFNTLTNKPTTIEGYGLTDVASNSYVVAAIATKEDTANKNIANGYAGLDSSGKVPSTLLPSYVDDVLEYNNLAAFPVTGETGKIYVAIDTNKTYRYTGSIYVEISASPGSTDAVTEGTTNLYFTNARVRVAPLTSFTPAATRTTILSTDNVLTAFNKIQKYLNDISAVGFAGDFASLTNKPTTLAGYGITDGASLANVALKANITDVLDSLAGKSDVTHTHDFASLTNKPTTISGYGLTDAASTASVAVKANISDMIMALANKSDTSHTHTWSDILSKPTTLAGYNITDAATSNDKINSISTYSVANSIVYYNGNVFSDISLDNTLSITNNTLSVVSSSGIANLNFTTGEYLEESYVLSTNIKTTSKLRVSINTNGNNDHNDYEHRYLLPSVLTLSAGNITANTGFSIFGMSTIKLKGNVSINWEWSN